MAASLYLAAIFCNNAGAVAHVIDWPTIALSGGIALVTALTVAFLGPRFQHLVWKKQKIREQRIVVAERFLKIWASPDVAGHYVNFSTETQYLETTSLYLEQLVLLALIPVLFDEHRTRDTGMELFAALNEKIPNTASSEHVRKLSEIRVRLLTFMFAEAFGISTNNIPGLLR